MASDGWSSTAERTFGSPAQATKVVDIFNMGMGWEVWAQLELALQYSREAAHDIATGTVTQSNFYREQAIYASGERCDFIWEYVKNNRKIIHFVELKCLIQRDSLDAFTKKVGKDIEKVRDAINNNKVVAKWHPAGSSMDGWVMAITVEQKHTGHGASAVETAMKTLATKEKIHWHEQMVINAPDNHHIITIWTWNPKIKN